MSYSIGIDIGGTFTDFLALDNASGEQLIHKSSSTPDDPSVGLLTGLREIAERLEMDPGAFLEQVDLIVHGTTVATNAVLTGRGAKTGLLTTKGFRDILEMRRGVRSHEHLYDNKFVPPSPLVPRHLRLPVGERVGVDGSVIAPLDEEEVRLQVNRLLGEEVEAIAVCFMHAYANPAHEERAVEITRELAGDRFVSASTEVLPQIRLYDRISTTAMNAYVGPVVHDYVERLVERLRVSGFVGTLLVMQSNGGVASADLIARLPASTVLSGPAAGPVAALEAVRPSGSEDCILIEMGGTSFDTSMVKDGAIEITQSGEVNHHSVSLPMTAIHTIGAGGGSIAGIDEGGLLRVGPQSAGAQPGPVCYGRGGEAPTVTDADLVLGYLNPEFFLGGRMRLRDDLAREAIESQIAEPLGLSMLEAAAGINEVVNLKMAAGTKDISVRRGHDPREFPIVVGGGAGPLHGAAIGRELDVPLLVVPRQSSIFCAAGMLLADLRHDYSRSFVRRWDGGEHAAARTIVEELAEEGRDALVSEGVPPERHEIVAGADLRYVGQHHEITASFDPDDLGGEEDVIAAAFHRRHAELYGFELEGHELEIMNLRVTVTGRRLDAAAGEREATDSAPKAERGSRPAWLETERVLESVPVYDGTLLRAGASLSGPALVELPTTTVWTPEDFDLRVDRTENFLLYRKGTDIDAL